MLRGCAWGVARYLHGEGEGNATSSTDKTAHDYTTADDSASHKSEIYKSEISISIQ